MVRVSSRAGFSPAAFFATVAVAASLLLVPLWIFLRFHGASLFSSHALLVSAAGLGCAGIVALVSERFVALRPVVVAALVAGFAELQSGSALDGRLLAAIFVFAAGACYLLRNHWAALGPVALAFLLSSALLPVGSDGHDAAIKDAALDTSARADLPPIVHLVLDEQIGVEGIPREFDADGSAARTLRDTYLERGFQVFGRAYSRHFLSRDSFSAMFNRGEATRYAGTTRRVYIARNHVFRDLAERGYRLRVLQTDYLDLCAVQAGFEISMCRSFALETPLMLDRSDLSLENRSKLLVRMMLRLSSRFPAPETSRVSAIAANEMLNAATDEVARLKPGVALFVHVMLPHFPYAYGSNCELRPDPTTWAYGEGAEGSAEHYSVAGRKLRYPLYLAQAACAQQRVGQLLDALDANRDAEGAWVVVHGDHGSRIATTRPEPSSAERLSPTDMTDAYSTFFAVRKSGYRARYDRRLLPIEALVPAALGRGAFSAAADWMQPPYVVLADKAGSARVGLPAFERRDAVGTTVE